MLRDKRIQILRRLPVLDEAGSPVRDENGCPEEKWEPITASPLWASVRDQSGREFYAAGAVQGERVIMCNIACRDGVDESMRVLFRGDEYEIIRIYRADYRKFDLIIDCRRIAREGA